MSAPEFLREAMRIDGHRVEGSGRRIEVFNPYSGNHYRQHPQGRHCRYSKCLCGRGSTSPSCRALNGPKFLIGQLILSFSVPKRIVR